MRYFLAASLLAVIATNVSAQTPRVPVGTMTAPNILVSGKQILDAYQLPCISVAFVEVYDPAHLAIVCVSGEKYATVLGPNTAYAVPWVTPEHLANLQIDPVALARAQASSPAAVSDPTSHSPAVAPPSAQVAEPAQTAAVAPAEPWIVEVQRDEFAGTQRCSIVSADGKIEIFTDFQRNQMVGFKLSGPASQPVFRVDNRRPENFNYLIMSASVHAQFRSQWAQGVVLIPYKQVSRGRTVVIRSSAESSPETFDISTIPAGMRAAEARGCLRTLLWDLG